VLARGLPLRLLIADARSDGLRIDKGRYFYNFESASISVKNRKTLTD
jgi:hypothetical protein